MNYTIVRNSSNLQIEVMVGHLRNIALVLRAQRSSRHMNFRMGGLMFDSCTPNTRVLTSQGSWIEIIQAFFSAAGGCSEMSVCFPLATKLPEMHPFSDIQY